ncbi:MAG: lecithin retinol acyltransferase family protein [Cyanobacteriota bacterium]|nr:lecithin retinol acyltransferase family protein [Cyanobacteriota bacterium]
MARGNQIYAYREFLNLDGVYEHHGIDCGDGTVIHYRKPSEVIEQTSMATFARGGKVYVRSYPVRYIADTVVMRAKSRLGESKYNLLFNNCEHFATWCVTGVSDSHQIRNFIPLLDQFDVDKLYRPIQEALTGIKKDNAPLLLDKALADIRIAWDDVQPKYKQALEEMETWQKVATKAMKMNREDLARQALQRKVFYKKRAQELEENLESLAAMTQNLIANQKNLQIL